MTLSPSPTGSTWQPTRSSNPSLRTNRNRTSYGKNNNIGNVPPPFGYTVSDAQIKFPSMTILCFEWAPNQGGGDTNLEDPGAPNDDALAADLVIIKRVQRLTPFEHDVVGHVHDVVDRPQARRDEALAQPLG